MTQLRRELQESLFYDKALAVDEDATEIRLRPGGGRLPGADRLPVASAAKAIPAGPPGVAQPTPRDGGPSSWKEDSWRSPFKGAQLLDWYCAFHMYRVGFLPSCSCSFADLLGPRLLLPVYASE